MAESYDIHLTDPLSSAFKVRAFTSNGTVFPTTTNLSSTAVGAETSLLVYGKGHANYGERIAENILHLLENFSGSSEPQYPVSGQLWHQRYTMVTNGGSWWLYTDGSGWAAQAVTNTANINSVDVSAAINGSYYYDTGTTLLYMAINDTTHPLSPTFLQREYELVVVDPTVSLIDPRKVLRVYNGEVWEDVANVYASSEEPTDNMADGDLWYDTGDQNLYIYLSSSWVPISGNYLPLDGSEAMTGNIDMGSNYIINLATPPAAVPGSPAYWNYAATVEYVNNAISGAAVPVNLGDLSNVNAAADSGTLRQALVVTSTGPTVWNASTLVTTDLSGVTVTFDEVNALAGVSAALTVQEQLDLKIDVTGGSPYAMLGPFYMNGNELVNARVTPLPSFDWDIANKGYVDFAIAAAGGTDTYIQSVQFFAVDTAGSPPRVTGDLVFQYNDTTPEILVSGISPLAHVHTAADITYNQNEDTLLSKMGTQAVNVDEAITQLDGIIRRRTNKRRYVQTVAAGSPATRVTFTVPEYSGNYNQLFVFVNGIKYIASEPGENVIELFPSTITNSTLTYLGAGTWTATVYVDSPAGSPYAGIVENISVVGGSPASTFGELMTAINADLNASHAVLEDGEMIFYSDTYGDSSGIVVIDGNLFGTGLSTYSPVVTGIPGYGTTYGYSESAGHGETGLTITFETALTAGSTIEAIVIGDITDGVIL